MVKFLTLESYWDQEASIWSDALQKEHVIGRPAYKGGEKSTLPQPQVAHTMSTYSGYNFSDHLANCEEAGRRRGTGGEGTKKCLPGDPSCISPGAPVHEICISS